MSRSVKVGAARPRSGPRGGPGFRIGPPVDRLDPELVAALGRMATADLSDAMNRLAAMDPGVRRIAGPARFSGVACTVRLPPGDNLMLHKALDVVRPGDVLVVAAVGGAACAVVGDLVATKARHRGVAAVVVDGFVRDLDGLVEAGLPVWARGASAGGPFHRGPGEIDLPVACGGQVVAAGDVVVGDSNGCVVIPSSDAAEVLARARATEEALRGYHESVRRGEFSNEWVDAALRRSGWIEPPDGD